MKTYRPRPPVYEAIQITEENRAELVTLPDVRPIQEGHYLLEDNIIEPGWWIFRRIGAERFGFLTDDVFRATYEESAP